MAYYAKKVVYLSEMEYGNKIKGAGFVRMEFSGEACSLDMHVSGMTSLPQKKYNIAVVLISGKLYDIGDIYIHNGSGEWKARYENGYLQCKCPKEAFFGNEVLSCAEIAELQIKISDTKVISGKTGLERNTVKAAQIPEEKKYWSEKPGRRWEFLRSGLMDKRLNNLDMLEEPEEENLDEPMRIENIKEDGLMQEVTLDYENRKGLGSVGEIERIGRNKMEVSEEEGVRKRVGASEDIGGRKWTEASEEMGAGRWTEASKEIGVGRWEEVNEELGDSRREEAEARRGIRKEARFRRDAKVREESKAGREMEINGDIGIQREIEKGRKIGIEAENQMDAIILNDKWDQLRQIYPVVHPYEDEREYISIEPKDFVIMTGDYQHLANNSFLLHGFYNYRHIVLGRERDGFFYVGVPGVYYEREKMVALMFGFEAFECNGEKAEAGKFGYYLRKVRI